MHDISYGLPCYITRLNVNFCKCVCPLLATLVLLLTIIFLVRALVANIKINHVKYFYRLNQEDENFQLIFPNCGM